MTSVVYIQSFKHFNIPRIVSFKFGISQGNLSSQLCQIPISYSVTMDCIYRWAN
jgi:hypothetical protein